MGPRKLFIAVVAAIAIVVGAWLSWRVATAPTGPESPDLVAATRLPAPADLPEFSLLDHTGRAAGRKVFEGQWDLVFFGFTHCPDVCPLTLQVLAAAREELREAGHAPLPRIILVSVDPERDTPDKLAQYLGYFGDDHLGLTGSLDQTRTLTGAIGIFFEKSMRADGDYLVDHSSVVIVVDPDGRFSALFSSPHEIENFVHDLPLLMSSR